MDVLGWLPPGWSHCGTSGGHGAGEVPGAGEVVDGNVGMGTGTVACGSDTCGVLSMVGSGVGMVDGRVDSGEPSVTPVVDGRDGVVVVVSLTCDAGWSGEPGAVAA
jgi:hypothetical protein